MTLLDAVRRAKDSGDATHVVSSIPYFRFLGLQVGRDAQGSFCQLPEDPRLIGNPRLPALHGGVVGALLESAAIVELIMTSEAEILPKTINITIDYLRSARPILTFARGSVTKHGRRVANVRVEAWQDDPAKPVAAAHAHFLIA